MDYLAIACLISFGCAAISIIIVLVRVTLMLGKLRRLAPAEFERLGSPHLLMNNTPRTNWRIFVFLKDREYESIADTIVVASASATRNSYVVSFSLLALSFALLLATWAAF